MIANGSSQLKKAGSATSTSPFCVPREHYQLYFYPVHTERFNRTLNPWSKKSRAKASDSTPFYGVEDDLPILLALICGFQHSLAMLAGVSKSVIYKR
jgi:hypothetical protein